MKNIFLLILLLSASITLYSQKSEYFKPIFNEHDLSGWNMPGKVPGFIVENGIMIARPHDTSDIFTEEFFGNYVLRFEYLLSEVGNSGVLIRSDPQDPWRTG